MVYYFYCFFSRLRKGKEVPVSEVKDYVRDNCKCPVPCDFLIYDPTISFASTSVYATERLLASTASANLHQKFMKARETTARMDPLKFRQFRDLAVDMRSRFTKLRNVIDVDVRSRLIQQHDTLMEVHDYMKKVYLDKLYLVKWQKYHHSRLSLSLTPVRWQKYHVDKNFVRARQAMEERTLMALALGFQEFSYQVESRIWEISHGPPSSSNVTLSDDVKTGLFLDALNLINGRVDLAERAFANFTQLYGAFYNGTPIFRYKYENEPPRIKHLRDAQTIAQPVAVSQRLRWQVQQPARRAGSTGVRRNLLLVYRDLLEQSFYQGNRSIPLRRFTQKQRPVPQQMPNALLEEGYILHASQWSTHPASAGRED
ncbi:hypothetical protein RRG08_059590 [Elysia crispata]|uniref:Uncharacterized protein n=1 Tax=Elysia crispata TaxID=231223 RepID=A0AAE0YZ60_9GAST|nr:hypothetical protein RRG08_059590 [Elysia crispata]